MYKKILVAIDASPNAAKAEEVAMELAGIYKAEVTIIHVIEPPVQYTAFSGEVPLTVTQSLMDELEKNGERLLAEHAAKYVYKGIKITTEMHFGHVADTICDRSREEKFDLIVIGNRGMGAVKRYLLGSVSDKVSHHSLCSVLIVK